MGNKNGDLIMAQEWLMYPNIPHGSIEWRIGYFESCCWEVFDD